VPTAPLPPGSQTTPGLVLALGRLEGQRLRAGLEARGMAGLRPAHAAVLVPLLAAPRRASDLAELLGVSRQAVAQAVGGLEAGGYVAREPDPDDARAKRICLTAAGRAGLLAIGAAARALEREWAEGLGEERLAVFRQTLVDLAALTRGPGPAGPVQSKG
jgi:DNA-binding MarR family transcriptional regulator